MATGMKVWLGVLIGSCVLVVWWAFPPREGSIFVREALPEEERFAELSVEIRRAQGMLMANRWSDSLSALVVDTAVEGVALAHPPSDEITPEGEAEWRTMVSAFVDSLRPRDPAMKVAIVFQYDLHGAAPGAPAPRFGLRTQIYVGERNGSPYCIVVHPERYAVTNSQLRIARTLEGCTLHAKYGTPGPAVAEWLESGGFAFAQRGRLAFLDSVIGPPRPPELPFGMVRPFQLESLAVAGCMAGDETACVRVVTDPAALAASTLDPLLVAQSPLSHAAGNYRTSFWTRSQFLLSELEARYGSEAFARFWTSDAEVPAAFEEAFGTALGAWMREFVQSEIGVYRAGTSPRAAALGWSAVLILLFSGFASVKQLRRRVG